MFDLTLPDGNVVQVEAADAADGARSLARYFGDLADALEATAFGGVNPFTGKPVVPFSPPEAGEAMLAGAELLGVADPAVPIIPTPEPEPDVVEVTTADVADASTVLGTTEVQ